MRYNDFHDLGIRSSITPFVRDCSTGNNLSVETVHARRFGRFDVRCLFVDGGQQGKLLYAVKDRHEGLWFVHDEKN